MSEEPVIITAVAAMTAHGGINVAADMNSRIQAAMVAAIVEAQAAGVTDVEELRAVQLAARDRVLAEGVPD